MEKLLTKFLANPTFTNALALDKYNRKHPMAICMMTLADAKRIAHICAASNWNAAQEWIGLTPP